MRISILRDLEGVAGMVDFHKQTYGSAKYYPQSKRLTTVEVHAWVERALEGGAAEIWLLYQL